MLDRNLKIIGVSEYDGNDTEFGALICTEFKNALINNGYNAKHLLLDDEFNCDICLKLLVGGTKEDLSIEVVNYDIMASCSKRNMKLSDINTWMKSVIPYLVSECIIPPSV